MLIDNGSDVNDNDSVSSDFLAILLISMFSKLRYGME